NGGRPVGRDEGDLDGYGNDTRPVVAAQQEAPRPDVDPDKWRYEGFTAHGFWQAVHPPMPGYRRGKYPPADKQTVPLPRWLYRVTGAWPERSLLALLVYYFQLSRRDEKVRARRRYRGHLWVAKAD